MAKANVTDVKQDSLTGGYYDDEVNAENLTTDDETVDGGDEDGTDTEDADDAGGEETGEEGEEGDEEENADEEGSDDATGKSDAKQFSRGQQQRVNEIIQERLERQERSLIKRFTGSAGTTLDGLGEVDKATKLWGVLKENPELSTEVNNLINKLISEGKAKMPVGKVQDGKETELNKREAILDLKTTDKAFASYSKEILDWADSEGFEITDEKSLKLAYMAWRGANSEKLSKVKQKAAEQKQTQKQVVKQKAKVQPGRSKTHTTTINFRRMSDADILAKEGLSLFID